MLADLRIALRGFARNPGFAAVAMVILALGIGANTALFSVVNEALLKGLPAAAPDQLVVVGSRSEDGFNASFSYPMFRDLRDRNEVLAGLTGWANVRLHLAGSGEPRRINGALVSGGFFGLLGLQPAAGRFFTPEDDRDPGAHPVAVISHSLWQSQFGGDPAIPGRKIILNGQPITILGVAPAGFYGLEQSREPALYMPMMMTATFLEPATRLQNRRQQWLTILGRLRPGVSQATAAASLQVLYQQLLGEELAMVPAERRARAAAQRDKMTLELRPGFRGFGRLQRTMALPLYILSAVTGFVLLIACANLANLMLARATEREREVSIRAALGAGRWQLLRQFLAESLLLAAAGGALGILTATWIGEAVLRFLPDGVALSRHVSLDYRVFAFVAAVALLCAILFGLAPARFARRVALAPSLQRDSQGSDLRLFSLRGSLVVAQVALSLMLLAGAALFLRTLANLRSVDLGFDRQNLLTATITPALNKYTGAQMNRFFETLLEQIRALPGVRAASAGNVGLLTGEYDINGMVAEGYTPKPNERYNPHTDMVAPRYFETVGMTLAAGRDFTPQDREGAPRVAIINETMARYFWPGQNAVGKRIGFDGKLDTEIVGVLRDARSTDVREAPPRFCYLPVAQVADAMGSGGLTLYVRTAGDPLQTAALLRPLVRALDPNLPLADVRSVEAILDQALITERLLAQLTAGFALVATALAAVGLYGVLAFSVARRTREIGIRMALGAETANVAALVLRQTGLLVAIGVALGLAGAAALSRYVASVLFGVQPLDPLALTAAAALLALSALAASYLPVRRATRVDPLEALRVD